MALEFITQAPRQYKIIMGVVLLALIGAGGYYLLISPKNAEVNELTTRNASLQGEVAKNRIIAASLARFRQEAAALRQRLEAAKERLPTEKEMPGLYRQMSELAIQAGLSVSLFQPKDPQPKDIYSEVPITISAEAQYHQLGEFFARIARLARIVTLGDFKFVGNDSPKGAWSVRAELNLATYLLRPAGAPSRPPGAQK